MHKKLAITAAQLRAGMKTPYIPYATSEEIPLPQSLVPPQPRALDALNLALHIADPGYNIYLAGESNLGRSYMLNNFLQPRAKKAPVPPDLVYIHNFDSPDAPLLVKMPAGQGSKLKSVLSKALARFRKELPAFMERDSHTKRRNSLQVSFLDEKSKIINHMDKVAEGEGFKLDVDDNGSMTLYPVLDGKRLNEQDFENLAEDLRDNIKQKGDNLAQTMHTYLRKLGRAEQVFAEDEKTLEKDQASSLLQDILAPVVERFKNKSMDCLPPDYFNQIKEDILENLDYFMPQETQHSYSPGANLTGGFAPVHEMPPLDFTYRYEVNVFVDNSKVQGAPVVYEDHPTVPNLLGCIERESELGALVTNFTLAKAGSIHKANGGFLVMQIEELLQYPQAWDGLLRALRAGQARLDDSLDMDMPKAKGIKPEAVKLNLKVILIGSEDVYDALYMNDSRFTKLFGIKAQMSYRMPRNAAGFKLYLKKFRRIITDANLLHFDREAMSELVDYGSLLLEDQKYLSLEIPLLRQIMVEASAQAGMDGASLVTAKYLRKALQAREFRANFVEEAFMEEYDRNLIKVKTSGQGIGTVNGLSVTSYGDFEFGLPHQISCAVGVGHDGIIDLEREAELGGPIHTKAIMILKSYLVSQFARKKPLYLSGSICFEQSYAGIEGDSASGAELAALLSAIAQVNIDFGLAFTGALGQSGQIMAVGSVRRKVEGFFEVCRRHGLSGTQGVILPKDNFEQLILKPQVLEAIEKEQFHIYPVTHISEAMELLTNIPCGKLRKDGTFTPGSLFAKVDKRLTELTKLAIKAGHDKE
ncbi:MAG: AAA family ATPase [Deltaproteobacteria bacterium]|jgi:predicted ATP-dependent protease|nr:AAA family ATPase [Deltaproteobacteria bacterium]